MWPKHHKHHDYKKQNSSWSMTSCFKPSRRLQQGGNWLVITGHAAIYKDWIIWFDIFVQEKAKFAVNFPGSFLALASRREDSGKKPGSCIFDMGWGCRIPDFASSYHMIMRFNIKALSYEIRVRGVCPLTRTQACSPGHWRKKTPERSHSDLKESHNSDPNALTARNIQGIWRLFLVHFTALSGE